MQYARKKDLEADKLSGENNFSQPPVYRRLRPKYAVSSGLFAFVEN